MVPPPLAAATGNAPGGVNGAASFSGSHKQLATDNSKIQWLQLWLMRAFAASTAAWITVAPLVAWQFQSFTPIAPLANLTVVPWTSLLIAAGFLTLLLGMIWPAAALPFAASFTWGVRALVAWVSWMAGLPGAALSW